MRFFVIRSNRVAGNCPRFLGIAFDIDQIRIGLIWWHVGVVFNY